MRKTVFSIATAAMVMTSLAGVAPAAAETPGGLGDLVGARGSSVESELTSRGYKFEKNLGSAALWWNGNSRKCVSVAVNNGRVASIEAASASDCGKGGNDAAVAGVAVGAAAVGLIAALSGHHKSSNQRNNNVTYNSEYQRGYNDGLYASHYDQHDSEGYHSGYLAGETERNNRRASNTKHVRGAPNAAQDACTRRADQWWGFPAGSAVPVSVFDYGQGNYEVTVASGHYRARCSVNGQGVVADIQPF